MFSDDDKEGVTSIGSIISQMDEEKRRGLKTALQNMPKNLNTMEIYVMVELILHAYGLPKPVILEIASTLGVNVAASRDATLDIQRNAIAAGAEFVRKITEIASIEPDDEAPKNIRH